MEGTKEKPLEHEIDNKTIERLERLESQVLQQSETIKCLEKEIAYLLSLPMNARREPGSYLLSSYT